MENSKIFIHFRKNNKTDIDPSQNLNTICDKKLKGVITKLFSSLF